MGGKFYTIEKSYQKLFKDCPGKIFDLRKINHRGNTSTVCVFFVKNTDIYLPDTLQNASVQFNFYCLNLLRFTLSDS